MLGSLYLNFVVGASHSNTNNRYSCQPSSRNCFHTDKLTQLPQPMTDERRLVMEAFVILTENFAFFILWND